uniref:glycoside hydrolase family 24 protein n=1 Tax=Hylemonella sp. TaxID=2066020 RepID=UPI0035B34F16
MKWLIPAALVLTVAVVLARRSNGTALQDDMPDQTAGAVESLIHQLNPMQYLDDTDDQIARMNERAFLDMIAYAEGTSSPEGYRMMFGGGLFNSYADHPRVLHEFTNKVGQRLKTSAAGRYQFLARTWDELQRKLDLPDFGPASQDSAALELIRQRGALADVRAGRVSEAVRKVAPIWASLPGAGYNQPERKLSQLLQAYSASGGAISEA